MTTPDHAADERLQTILKAHVVGAMSPGTRRAARRRHRLRVHLGRRAHPPHDPETLAFWSEHSNSLRQNVDAYATNIDGSGYRFDAIIDFDAEDALEGWPTPSRSSALPPASTNAPQRRVDNPSVEEVLARFTELRQAARVERARLDVLRLRLLRPPACRPAPPHAGPRRSRQRLLGCFATAGRPRAACLVPSYTGATAAARSRGRGRSPSEHASLRDFDTVRSRRACRRYVQVQSTECVYFKSFGDPRVVSRSTGRVFNDIAALRAAKPDDGLRRSCFFAIHSPRSHGVPRWMPGTLLRPRLAADGGQLLYFENKSVPPMALLVSADASPGHRCRASTLYRGGTSREGELPQDPKSLEADGAG